jgi:hypothetical protein
MTGAQYGAAMDSLHRAAHPLLEAPVGVLLGQAEPADRAFLEALADFQFKMNAAAPLGLVTP